MEDQFETLESAYDFVALLAETVAEAKREPESDVQRYELPFMAQTSSSFT